MFGNFLIFLGGCLPLDTLETTFRACLILLYTAEKEMLVRFFSRKQGMSQQGNLQLKEPWKFKNGGRELPTCNI